MLGVGLNSEKGLKRAAGDGVLRRPLVEKVTDRVWSRARFYAGMRPVPMAMDPLPRLDG